MTIAARPPRPVTTIARQPLACPIPPMVFREPVYADGKPYEESEDDTPDGANHAAA